MPQAITDAEFDSVVLKSSEVVVMDFWAPWCGPCKAMLPIFDELEKEYTGKVKFVKMNVDENAEAPGKFNVLSIPTFIFFKKGEAVGSLVGARTKEEMKKEIDKAIA